MRTLAFMARRMSGEIYHDFMDSGFRRSGELFYQCICSSCRECTPIRVVTNEFLPSKSQRRVLRKNEDLRVSVGPPCLTEEKFQMYLDYLSHRHERADSTREDLERFLYSSPVHTIEFEYRDRHGGLVGASIADLSSRSLSSVYMFFSPREAWRSPGILSALYEINWARETGVPSYYLGFWVKGSASMRYKADFQPYEFLRTDGLWVR